MISFERVIFSNKRIGFGYIGVLVVDKSKQEENIKKAI